MVALGRESHWLCCLCFARWGPHAAFLYAVHTLATVVVPLFLFYCIQFVCCSCTFFLISSPLPLSLSKFTLHHPKSPFSFLIIFLVLQQQYCGDCKFPFLWNKSKKKGKWGSSEIIVFTTWLTAGDLNAASLETQHHSTVVSKCIVCALYYYYNIHSASPICGYVVHCRFLSVFLWLSLDQAICLRRPTTEC